MAVDAATAFVIPGFSATPGAVALPIDVPAGAQIALFFWRNARQNTGVLSSITSTFTGTITVLAEMYGTDGTGTGPCTGVAWGVVNDDGAGHTVTPAWTDVRQGPSGGGTGTPFAIAFLSGLPGLTTLDWLRDVDLYTDSGGAAVTIDSDADDVVIAWDTTWTQITPPPVPSGWTLLDDVETGGQETGTLRQATPPSEPTINIGTQIGDFGGIVGISIIQSATGTTADGDVDAPQSNVSGSVGVLGEADGSIDSPNVAIDATISSDAIDVAIGIAPSIIAVLASVDVNVDASAIIIAPLADLSAAVDVDIEADSIIQAPGPDVLAQVNTGISVSVDIVAPHGTLSASIIDADVDIPVIQAPSVDIVATAEAHVDADANINQLAASLSAVVQRPATSLSAVIAAPMNNVVGGVDPLGRASVDITGPLASVLAEAELTGNLVGVDIDAPIPIIDTDIASSVELAAVVDALAAIIIAHAREPGELSMASLIDAKYNTLRTLFPAGPPTISDLTTIWLRAEGGTGNTISDLWRSMLLGKGATPGPINDMWFEVLGNNGFSQPNVQGRELAFWQAGGNLA